MCCDDKCFFFIEVRTGSLIMGYIAAVLSAVGVLACVGVILFIACSMIAYTNIHFDLTVAYLVQLFFVEMTAGFTFTVLLLYGLTKNKAVLLKTYIIYGMVHLVLLLVVMIVMFCSFYLGWVGWVLLVTNGIYALFIYMVYLTYKIMVDRPLAGAFENLPTPLLP